MTRVSELMISQVMTATPSQTVGHVREVIQRNGVHALPVVNPEGEPIGIVSARDLLGGAEGTPISQIMTEKVYTIPEYADTHIAARMMRNHHIHRLVVTHEKQVVGILSSFDLLKLIEDRRFVAKNRSTPTKRKKGQRGVKEMGADVD